MDTVKIEDSSDWAKASDATRIEWLAPGGEKIIAQRDGDGGNSWRVVAGGPPSWQGKSWAHLRDLRNAARQLTRWRRLHEECREGAYGLNQHCAIVERLGIEGRNDRFYITQGYGGVDSIKGGAYRWRHGFAWRLPDGIDTLDAAYAYSRATPPEKWGGGAVERVAELAGLIGA